jgi:hypothetical protein
VEAILGIVGGALSMLVVIGMVVYFILQDRAIKSRRRHRIQDEGEMFSVELVPVKQVDEKDSTKQPVLEGELRSDVQKSELGERTTEKIEEFEAPEEESYHDLLHDEAESVSIFELSSGVEVDPLAPVKVKSRRPPTRILYESHASVIRKLRKRMKEDEAQSKVGIV